MMFSLMPSQSKDGVLCPQLGAGSGKGQNLTNIEQYVFLGARRIANQAQQAAGCQSGTSFFQHSFGARMI